MSYQQHSLVGENGVELIVALYGGMVRFLRRAIQAIDDGDVAARRAALRRTLTILIHLQSSLRMDIGGSSAKALAEFYAAIFALCLNGSRLASKDKLNEAITCILNVREAWSTIAHDPEVMRVLSTRTDPVIMRVPLPAPADTPQEHITSSWSA